MYMQSLLLSKYCDISSIVDNVSCELEYRRSLQENIAKFSSGAYTSCKTFICKVNESGGFYIALLVSIVVYLKKTPVKC